MYWVYFFLCFVIKAILVGSDNVVFAGPVIEKTVITICPKKALLATIFISKREIIIMASRWSGLYRLGLILQLKSVTPIAGHLIKGY